MIAGVCGGIGQYLGIDPLLVRIVFLVLLLGDGVGFLLYVVLWILMPEERGSEQLRMQADSGVDSEEEEAAIGRRQSREIHRRPANQIGILVGSVLILFGILQLIDNLVLPNLRWLTFDVLWPILLIAGGIALLFRWQRDR